MTKERAIVVFPGRGSYGAPELGYLKNNHGSRRALLDRFDAVIARNGGAPAQELDARESFSPSIHLPGRNASNLIYAGALADFEAINRDRFEIVAVCGNSLGWYMTLAAGGALTLENGAHVVDSMGHRMETEGTGGQILYPLVDAEWRRDEGRIAAVKDALQKANTKGRAFFSIRLGGIAVLAGDEAGLKSMLETLPKADERYPFRLPKHAAFHTPLLDGVSAGAKEALPASLFTPPAIPMIDGRGAIWTKHGTDIETLHEYTFGAQITETYDFSKSVEVALKEFAPARVILVGPGASLGPPVGQILIEHRWNGVRSKTDFSAMQQKSPFVLAMGRPDQREAAL
ncbi:MAG TPA: hypothetical protein P5072_12795 [Parvularculaceae bacterium]|nr:hypothetical protein [Parvularculaceae bacterium]